MSTTTSLNKKRSFNQIGSDDEEIDHDNEPAKKRIKLAQSNNANNKQQQNQTNNDSDDGANQQNTNQTNNTDNDQLTLIQEMTGIINNSQIFPKYIARLIAEFSIVQRRNCTKCKKEFDIFSSQKDAIFAFCKECSGSKCVECSDIIKQQPWSGDYPITDVMYDNGDCPCDELYCSVHHIRHCHNSGPYSFNNENYGNCGYCHPSLCELENIEYEKNDKYCMLEEEDESLCICNDCLVNKMECCYVHDYKCPIYFIGKKELFQGNDCKTVIMTICGGGCGEYLCIDCVREEGIGQILRLSDNECVMKIFCNQCVANNEWIDIDWCGISETVSFYLAQMIGLKPTRKYNYKPTEQYKIFYAAVRDNKEDEWERNFRIKTNEVFEILGEIFQKFQDGEEISGNYSIFEEMKDASESRDSIIKTLEFIQEKVRISR
eukprot:98843_1